MVESKDQRLRDLASRASVSVEHYLVMYPEESGSMGELNIIGMDKGVVDVQWVEGYKRVSWQLRNDEDLVPTLKDILATVEPMNQGPLFLAPQLMSELHKSAEGTTPPPWMSKPDIRGTNLPNPPNPGAEAADRAAREAEMALRNGGAAISREIAAEPLATYDNPADIPPVDWGK